MRRQTKCKNGNLVERFYDRASRSSVTRVIDSQGNQIGDADYSGDRKSADYVKTIMIQDNGGKQ